VVSGVAFQHAGKPSTTKAGVNLVNDGWYLTVKYYERTPPLAIDTFVLDESSDMIIDAEGVIFTGPSLALEPARPQRASRSRSAATPFLMRLMSAETAIPEIEASLKNLSSSVKNLIYN